ncbi:hypothetical protein RDV89_10180 [Nocardioides zeae]|uniref:PCRF domain-containing protein n=1 Tax=Nocardioides imazamoxiresistens TaxID=3231893 RepID=A0ABU3PW26_9ACTN|nr:hypothetical protein [Nocardioides zeae]MDT9593435.1 hypothetical protein [Nocardioides zeae]
MYGDADVIRRRSTELHEQAVDLRTLADRLVAGAESVDWPGRAANDLRLRMRDRAARLRDAAGQHETASEALATHGTSVADLTEAIADVERKVASLVADARGRQAELSSYDDAAGVTRTLDPDDQQLVDFAPPPSGHKDWLTVTLPGL